ncbi:MAG: FAD-binding protein [Polyangiales bacterium]
MTTLEIERDVPLAPLTSLELGGPAKYFVRAGDETTLVEALRWSADREMPSAILAGGSNLIVPDEGYEGLVVQMAIDALDFREGGTVCAGAGVAWETVVD